LINVRELDLRGFQARINGLEADLDSNNRKISHLIEVKDVKEQENVTTQQRIAKEQLTISQLRTQVAQLEKDISYFEAQNHKHQQS
jgi:chromosome segregation ATPase